MNRPFLFSTVFIAGMAVMAVELTASRLLAPYFGTSLFVWTNLIGVVLLALSIGYFLGGKLADREGGRKTRRELFLLILGAGIFIGLTPWIAKPIFRFSYHALPRGDLSIFFPSLLSIFILLSLPMLFLGMVTPLAARLGIRELSFTGRVIGNLYAFSTAGSLVGTFLPVLVTIPYLGSRRTFFLFGALLTCWGALGLSLKRPALALPAALPFLFFLMLPLPREFSDIRFEKESSYNLVRVWELPTELRALVLNEGIGVQSIYHGSRVLTGEYWDGAALLPALYPEGKKFLFLGLGAGTSARLISHYFPHLELEGVELDPVVVEAGRKFFGLDRIPIRFKVGDGRVLLEGEAPGSYDFIMVDAAQHNFSLPFHLSTREFFELLRSRLSPKGAMVMNVFAPSTDSRLFRLVKNTLATVFPAVYEYQVKDLTALLFAFQQEPASRQESSLPSYPPELNKALAKIPAAWKPVRFEADIGISEDDRPTVELLSARSIFLKRPNIVPVSLRTPSP